LRFFADITAVEISYLVVTASLECGLSITAMSLATLRPLLRHVSSWFRLRFGFRNLSNDNSTLGTETKEPIPLRSSQPYKIPEASGTEKSTSPILVESALDNQTFLLDTINSVSNETQPGTNAPMTFYLETMQSRDREMRDLRTVVTNDADTIDRTALSPSSEAGHDLERNVKRDSLSKRAIWWPLPGSPIVDDPD
jgi:hypothetical protein